MNPSRNSTEIENKKLLSNLKECESNQETLIYLRVNCQIMKQLPIPGTKIFMKRGNINLEKKSAISVVLVPFWLSLGFPLNGFTLRAH